MAWYAFFALAFVVVVAHYDRIVGEHRRLLRKHLDLLDTVRKERSRPGEMAAQARDKIAALKAQLDALKQAHAALQDQLEAEVKKAPLRAKYAELDTLERQIETLAAERRSSEALVAGLRATLEEALGRADVQALREDVLVQYSHAEIDDGLKGARAQRRGLLRANEVFVFSAGQERSALVESFLSRAAQSFFDVSVARMDRLPRDEAWVHLSGDFERMAVVASRYLGVVVREALFVTYHDELRWLYAGADLKERRREEQAALKERMREEAIVERERARALAEAEASRVAAAKLQAQMERTRLEEAERERAMQSQQEARLAQLRAELEAAGASERAALQERLYASEAAFAQQLELDRAGFKAALAEQDAAYQQELAQGARKMSLAQQTTEGFVYIISNIGSFGSDVFKIGMTRRLKVEERIHELNNASVPFPFDVHAAIRTTDAPELEHRLHKHFVRRAMNKVNARKEFFRISIDELVAQIASLGVPVEWSLEAKCEQFRSSQAEDRKLAESEAQAQLWEQAERSKLDAQHTDVEAPGLSQATEADVDVATADLTDD
jgi:hypothetical protein